MCSVGYEKELFGSELLAESEQMAASEKLKKVPAFQKGQSHAVSGSKKRRSKRDKNRLISEQGTQKMLVSHSVNP